MRLHRLALSALLTIAAAASACSKAADTSDSAAAAGSGAATVPGGGIDAARLGQHVAVLAADSFMGRGPATAGEEKAVAYISAQMKQAGLEPGGPNGSWYQEVPLNQYDVSGTPTLAITVGGKRSALTQGEQVAIRASMRNQDAVKVSAPMVFLGYGVKAPERNWDDFKGQDLKGKVGVVLINDPDFETGQGDFGGKAMTYYGRWTYKFEEAARQGLAGLLIVHETAPASYGWNTVKNSNTNTMFDIVRQDPSQSHPLVEGWMQRDVAAKLFKDAGLDFDALKKQAQSREFKPVAIGNATFDASFNVRRQTIRTRNVLGRLPGSAHADETVLYGAHWDHLGIGAKDARGDSIYNGAVDNATGVAALLELARVFAAGPRPQRSIVFAAWTAEEKGLIGSEYYASNPVYPLEKTVAGLNIDAMSAAGPSRDVLVIGYGQSELEARLTQVLKESNRTVARDAHPEAGYFYRSDHFPLAKRGVPMLYIESGKDLVTGGASAGEAADSVYNDARYHQPADEYDPPKFNTEGMAQDVTALYRVGLELANSREWPNYLEGSEFRPVRDKSASSRK
jgi:Zn-dependent M28 family amino/carboxypeptidase